MRIVIVEDQLMFREALRKACVQDLGHQVVGETESGLVGVTLVAKHRPDVLLLDLSLPELDGFSVIERIRPISPATKIIVVSGYLDDYTLLEIDKADVHGFVDKNTNQIATLKAALLAVAAGKKYFSATYTAVRRNRLKDPNWFTKLLSRAELRVLALIGLGLDNAEIGSRLGISPRTAQVHRTNILAKLKLRGTPKLIMYALQRGFTARTSSRVGESETLKHDH
jgi:DNA-binding NarL/FixJ family response regulator